MARDNETTMQQVNPSDDSTAADQKNNSQDGTPEESQVESGADQNQDAPRLQKFHQSLLEDQSLGVVRGVPEDYRNFEYSFQDEDYRRKFHNYLLAEQIEGNVRGIPRDMKDFTHRFAPDLIPPEPQADPEAGMIDDAARNSTIDMSLLDAPGLSNDMIEAMQSQQQVSASMIDSIGQAGKKIRSHLEQVQSHRRNLVSTDFYGMTFNNDDEVEYVGKLKETGDSLKGQLFQAYSTLKNERDRLERTKKELEEEYTVPFSGGGHPGAVAQDVVHRRVPEKNKAAYNEIEQRINKIDERIEDVQPSGTDRIRHSVNSFLGSLTGEIPAGFFEGVAILSSATNKMMRVVGKKTPGPAGRGIETVRRLLEGEPGKYEEVQELATWQIGQKIREMAADQFPTDPTMQDEFVETMLPAATGSFGAFAAGGFGARALRMSASAFAGTAAATGGMGQAYSMAKAYGASEEDAQLAGQWGFVPGVIQVLPVIRLLDRYDRAAGGQLKRSLSAVFKEGRKGSLEEALVEASGQAGFEQIADQIYREEPELLKSMDKIGQAAGAGAFAGFIANIITGGAARGLGRRRPQKPPTEGSDGEGGDSPPPGGDGGGDGPTPVDLDGPGITYDQDAPADQQKSEILDQIETMESVRDMMADQGQDTSEYDQIIKAGYNEISRVEFEQESAGRPQPRPEASPSIAGLLTDGSESVTESQREQLESTQQKQQNLARQGTIGDAVGSRVDYGQYSGRLTQDSEGTFVVETADGIMVEVADTQKDPDVSLEEAGIERNFASMRQFTYDQAEDNFVMEMPDPQTGEVETGRFDYVRTNTNDAGEPVSVTMTNEAGQERTFRAPEAVEDVIWGQFFSEGTDMQALDREMRRALDPEQGDVGEADAAEPRQDINATPPEVSLDDGDVRLDPVFQAFDSRGTLTEDQQTDALDWANEKLDEIAEANPPNASELISTLEQFELEVLTYGEQQTTPDMGDGPADGDQAAVPEPSTAATQQTTEQPAESGSESEGATDLTGEQSGIDAEPGGTTGAVQQAAGGAEQGGAESSLNIDSSQIELQQPGNDGEYKYNLLLRPFDIGTYPENDQFVRYEDDGSRYGAVIYDKPLTREEIEKFDLHPKDTLDHFNGEEIVWYQSDGNDYKALVTIERDNNRGKTFVRLDKKDETGEVVDTETISSTIFMERMESGEYFTSDTSDQPQQPSPSSAQPEQFAEEVQQRIIRVDVGRGKTGKAKSGTPRFMTRDADAQEKLEAGIRKVYDSMDDPVPWDEFLATSRKSIMEGLVTEDVGLVVVDMGDQPNLYLWNDKKLPQLGPRTLQKMEIQNDLQQDRNVSDDILSEFPDAAMEMGTSESTALDVQGGDYSMWIDDSGEIHFYNKSKGREVGSTSKYFNDAFIEFTTRRWEIIPNTPIEQVAPVEAIEAANGDFAQLVNDHSEHLYDFTDAIQDRINKGQHTGPASDGKKEITDDFLSGQVTLSHEDIRSFRPDAWADFPILRMKSTRDAPTDPALIADRINDKWNTDLTESDVVDLFIEAHTGDVKRGDFTDPLTQSLADRASELIGQQYTRDMHNQLLEAIDARRGDVTVKEVRDAQKLIDHDSFDATLMFDDNGNLIVDQAAQQIADLAAQDAEFAAYNQGELSPEMIQELQNENRKETPARRPTSESPTTDSPAAGENEGTTPAQRQVAKQIAAAQTEVQKANNARSAKIKELEETLRDDARDLFGNKKPSEQASMFDIQADPNQIPEALKPFNARLQRAQDELQRLYEKRDNLDPSNEPDIFQQNDLEQRAGELRSELNTLLNELDRMSGGQLSAGIDPRLVAQSARIIAKGAQLGFVRFQQFANYIAENYGGDFWNEIFDSFKASYVARMRKQDNPNSEDLDAIQGSTADQWLAADEGEGVEAGTTTTEREQGADALDTSAEETIDSPDQLFPADAADKGLNVPDAPDGLFTVGREYTDAQREAIETGRFGARKPEPTFTEKFKDAKYLAGKKFRQEVIDQFNSLNRILDDKRAWMMAHLSQASTGALEGLLDYGRPFIKDNTLAVNTNQKSFKQILEPLGKELDDWFRWMAGNRAYQIKQEDARRLAEWEASGKEGPEPSSRELLFSDEKINALRSLNEGKTKDGQDRAPLYDQVREDYEVMNEAVVDIAVQTGLVNADQAQDWADEGFYVPFYRMVDKETRGPKVFKDELAKQTAFKKLKGSDIPLDDLLGNVIMNWNHLLSASMRNQAAAKALDTAAEMGLAEKVVEAKASKDAIWVRRDGDKVFYEFDDSQQSMLVMDSLLSLNFEGLNSGMMKISRKFKRGLTVGVTASPEFKLRNLFRDTIHTAAVAPLSVNIVKNVYNGFKLTKRGSESQANMITGGGAFGDSGYIHGTDPELLRRTLNKGVDRNTVLDTRVRIQKMWDAYQDFGARLENVNRAAAFAETLRRGGDLLEANFESRDVLDFSRVGANGSVRRLAQIVPFLNARLQGMDKMYRALEDPKQRKQFGVVVGTYSLAAVGLYLMMKDDEDFQEAEQWERDAYHLFKLPGSDVMYRLPKPFEVGVIGTMAERLTEQAVDDDVHGELFAERLGHAITQTLSFNPTPQVALPMMEIIANKSFFTDRPIENMGMQRLSPELRRRAWTSQTAIGASLAMDKILWDDVVLSPVQVEHLVNGYLGWIGGTTLAATDMLIARPLAQSPARPSRRISDYPVIGAFAREGDAPNSRYVTNYYENLNEITRAWSDIREYRELGQLEKAESKAEEYRDILRFRTGYNRVQRRMSEINKSMERVYRDPDMSPEEKREQIDELISVKKQMAQNAVQATEPTGEDQ